MKKRREVVVNRPSPRDWQLEEIGEGIKELDSGQAVTHEAVAKWLRSWGKPDESKALTKVV